MAINLHRKTFHLTPFKEKESFIADPGLEATLLYLSEEKDKKNTDELWSAFLNFMTLYHILGIWHLQSLFWDLHLNWGAVVYIAMVFFFSQKIYCLGQRRGRCVRNRGVNNNFKMHFFLVCYIYKGIMQVESALRQNYKSYGAWHHRKWVLSKGYSSIEREFRLLDQFLKADSRNFNGWNYLRWCYRVLVFRLSEDGVGSFFFFFFIKLKFLVFQIRCSIAACVRRGGTEIHNR